MPGAGSRANGAPKIPPFEAANPGATSKPAACLMLAVSDGVREGPLCHRLSLNYEAGLGSSKPRQVKVGSEVIYKVINIGSWSSRGRRKTI